MCSQANRQESENTLNKSSALKGTKNSEGDEVFQTFLFKRLCLATEKPW